MADTDGEQAGRNGSRRLLWWLLGLATTIVLAGGAAWASNVNSRLTQIENTQQIRAERLAVLEAIIMRIEAKIDRLQPQ